MYENKNSTSSVKFWVWIPPITAQGIGSNDCLPFQYIVPPPPPPGSVRRSALNYQRFCLKLQWIQWCLQILSWSRWVWARWMSVRLRMILTNHLWSTKFSLEKITHDTMPNQTSIFRLSSIPHPNGKLISIDCWMKWCGVMPIHTAELIFWTHWMRWCLDVRLHDSAQPFSPIWTLPCGKLAQAHFMSDW